MKAIFTEVAGTHVPTKQMLPCKEWINMKKKKNEEEK